MKTLEYITEMGIDRINKNLKFNTNNVVEYCKNKVSHKYCNISTRQKLVL